MRGLRARSVVAIAIAHVLACGSAHEPAPQPVALANEAYVWQRVWSPAVRAAVAAAPDDVTGLRVLVAEVGPTLSAPEPTLVALDPAALVAAHRPITLVLRIDGAHLISGVSFAPIVASAHRLAADGVPIAGVEIDHDCATARLPEYAAWLAASRPRDLRVSITALPTWATSPDALADVAHAVDEIVVQVHAVRAPAIFEPDEARRGLARFAAALPGSRLRVALPTYRATVAGELVAADPASVGAFANDLERDPIAGVVGIVWFRLPIGDADTWSPQTFAAVVAHHPIATDAEIRVELRDRGDGGYDIVATNVGDRAAELPAIRLTGDIDDAELVAGYTPRREADRRWTPPHRALRAGATNAIGWVRGKAPHVEIE